MSTTHRIAIVVALSMLVPLAGCDRLRQRAALRDGNHFFKAQEYEKAIGEYAKILQSDESDWQANYLTAVSHMALYHPGSTHPKDREYADAAIAGFARCLTLTPPTAEDLEKVRGYYLSMLISVNEHGRAVEFLEGLLRERPDDARLVAQIASLYANQGDFPNALKWFERRAELDPANKESWYTIGVLCWERSYKGGVMVSTEERRQLIDQGFAALERAIAIDPDYFEALSYVNLLHRELARVQAEGNDYAAAQESIKAADGYLKRALEARKKQMEAQKG
jgi:tetratricopeptide (TPR) repeat protein